MNDRELLQEYVRTRSDAAFAELVRRHVDLVYSTARRRVGESQMAADIAQAVFIHLARNAGSVRNADALPGWLYRTTCYEAASAIRSEQRRRRRETEAVNRAELEARTSPAWELVAPVLEEAMRELNRVEQDAMVLRFFGNKPFAEVGRILGLTEEAARKRVSRALDRLRAGFERRGVKVTSGVLAATLAAHAVEAAPAGLATTLATASLGAGTAGAGILSTITHTLTMTKSTVTILAIVAVSAIVVPLVLTQTHSATNVAPEVEVQGIDFEPLAADKNVLHMELINHAAEKRVFGVHIQTRSPRALRPNGQGLGWGRPYFFELSPGATASVRFVFKLFGPISDDSTIRLRFYTLASTDQYDFAKFDREVTYRAADLKRRTEAEGPLPRASEDQSRAARRLLNQVQINLRNNRYAEALQFFTQDYRDLEQIKDAADFEKHFVGAWKVFFWDKAEFLSLQPQAVFVNAGSLRLEARGANQTWSLSLVQQAGQWKIDSITGYRGAEN